MSEMVERVAQAIRKLAVEIDHRSGIQSNDAVWFADEYARAAIEAMRVPTTEMVNEGYTAPTHGDGCSDIPSVWVLMIDVALAS